MYVNSAARQTVQKVYWTRLSAGWPGNWEKSGNAIIVGKIGKVWVTVISFLQLNQQWHKSVSFWRGLWSDIPILSISMEILRSAIIRISANIYLHTPMYLMTIALTNRKLHMSFRLPSRFRRQQQLNEANVYCPRQRWYPLNVLFNIVFLAVICLMIESLLALLEAQGISPRFPKWSPCICRLITLYLSSDQRCAEAAVDPVRLM